MKSVKWTIDGQSCPHPPRGIILDVATREKHREVVMSHGLGAVGQSLAQTARICRRTFVYANRRWVVRRIWGICIYRDISAVGILEATSRDSLCHLRLDYQLRTKFDTRLDNVPKNLIESLQVRKNLDQEFSIKAAYTLSVVGQIEPS